MFLRFFNKISLNYPYYNTSDHIILHLVQKIHFKLLEDFLCLLVRITFDYY
jgi:hypothetical protein